MTSPYNNQQLFSDHYLEAVLPKLSDWTSLTREAQTVKEEITAIFKQYKPRGKEAQTEYKLVRPILEKLGHTFEVQPSLAMPDGTNAPDYIFYRDEEALNANINKKLTDILLQEGAIAVGDAKYWDCPLDTGTKGTNKNPSYQIFTYILHSGLEWGILTNGRLWRLYHKSTAHKLDHYYEVDVPALLVSRDDEAFLYFYVFFRRAAFDEHPLSIAAILKESLDYAQGISEALKQQVYEALRHVAQGFIDYPSNHLVLDSPTKLKDIYDNSLILLYRLLFILYAEARNLLPLKDSQVYAQSYSLRSITQAGAKELDAGRALRSISTRIYHHLKELFGFINVGDPPLNISTFNGGLFDPQRHAFLEEYQIGDAHLEQAIDMLARVNRQFIDYRDLSVRHLGTIYEGLLEYHLQQIVETDGWIIDLLNEKGERKATGSYYTPEYIVKYLVDQTVRSIVQKAVEQVTNDKAKIDAILAIKVLDPSMGSGHFLVEATEYIARFLVELNIQPEAPITREAELAYWKRRVVQSCIYGIDLNPLAVELAKLSLWLSTVAKDRPLSFLDHHLRTGNSLIGTRLADLAVAPNGNGNGSSHKTRKTEAPREQMSFFDDEAFRQSMTTAVDLMWLVEASPAQTVEQVKEQEQLYATLHKGLLEKYGNIANLYTATRYGLKIDTTLWKSLVDFATGRLATAPVQFKEWLEAGTNIAEKRHFFHWELEFPEVFFDRYGQPKREQAGFDAVVGNPPWIRQEMFSEDKVALKRYTVYHGVADLYTYFIELGNTFLKTDGRFGFIVPNKFVRANYGGPLRNFLTTQVRLERLVDFGDLPVFREAVTYPLIMLTSKQAPDIAQVIYTRLKRLHPDNIADDIQQGEAIVASTAFTDEQWLLEKTNVQAIIDKMKAISIPLGQLVSNNIFYGIKTGFNEAFVIDRQTRDELIAQDGKSAEIIKPFVVGRDIKRYRVDSREQYITLTKIGTPIEQYPAVLAHLQKYQTQLEARWDKGNHWWELRACDYYEAFEQPKIIFPDIANGCQFAFDAKGLYSNNTTYIIPTAAHQKYLAPLLNSSLVEFFYRRISALIRGDYLRFFTQYVTQIPIRRINFTTPTDERTALTHQGITLYQKNDDREILAFIESCLAHQPEQSDVVHDLLVYLAEQMSELTQQRREKFANFMLDLQSVLSDSSLQKMNRLWTPPATTVVVEDKATKTKHAEAEKILGKLVTQQLDLQEDIGRLYEEQWKWLLKHKLGNRSKLIENVRAYRAHQPAIAALDQRIARTEHLINEVVYRLYGLTPEEIAIVEGK